MAAIVALAAGATGVVVTGTAQASFGSHHMMVFTTADVHGVFYSTSNSAGESITYCAALPDHASNEAVDGGIDVIDGKPVTMITFSSSTCTNGYVKRFDLTAPDDDGLTNWWVNLQ